MTTEARTLIAGGDTAKLPPSLVANADHHLVRFRERADDDDRQWLESQLADDGFRARLILVWGASEFVAESCLGTPELLRELVESGDLERDYNNDGFSQRLGAWLSEVESEDELHRQLRRFRRREMVRIVWRDFTRTASLLETTGDVSRLAEACIDGALGFLHPRLCQTLGTPVGGESGRPQQLVVLGMGKLGARELNLSSDIDLIFAFPEGGNTEGGKRELSNQEYFLRLSQKLIQALDKQTADGFVFRVDMRLRPYGESGVLALNFDALEEYYHTQGRDWERYAMVKARVVAGGPGDDEALMAILRPFTYRKYIDFGAIQALRDMKALINREVKRRGLEANIKKGAGGIREVEFVAQAFQLIRGGKEPRFRTPELKPVLALLDEEGLLPDGEGEMLWRAYCLLRDTEHALQGRRDEQTQLLPDDDGDRAEVAAVMGYPDWDSFHDELDQQRRQVRAVFEEIASEPVGEQEETEELEEAQSAWLANHDEGEMAADLADLGYRQCEDTARALAALRGSRAVAAMAARTRTRLDTFMPRLIAACGGRDNSDETLVRILSLVQAVVRRSAYLVLLIENPGALRQLVRLCSESAWIAEQIAQYPALLDELLDSRTLYTPMDKASLAQELRQHMLHLPADDLEAQMEVLRYFRRAQSLRIAACEVEGALPLMKSSDNLTWLAEVILETVLNLAWDWMVARHGLPGQSSEDRQPGMLIVGYGKLGGIELGHGSDLDLVFVHNAEPELATDGERSIDNATFFIRLGQRIIHILTTQTVSGILYEVDMRLRPDGNSGMLAIPLDGFAKYQRDKAWTWEHQALVRARPVAGNPALAEAFEQVRAEVLTRPRDENELRQEVLAMRRKMREHLGSSRGSLAAGEFNLKQDAGGIVDIEFMVQFAVLAWARDYPDLTRRTDNMRLLDALEDKDIISPEEAQALREAYIAYRSASHRLQLQQQPGIVQEADYVPHREAVMVVAERLLGQQTFEGEH